MKKKILIVSIFLILPFLCFVFFHLIIPYIWIKVDQAFHCGNYDRAIEYLSFISYIKPKDPESYILKAWLQWSQAKYLIEKNLPYDEKLKQAIETYRKGEKNNPTNWKIYFEEGIMWEAFGDKEKALRAYYISSKYSGPPYNKIYEIKYKKFNVEVK
ncbi:MAG: hypothetical protein NC901_01500 [Candidatus Omnitrophica bacterium]|nr:hypothetical protein [Candidatus Omnitrophota bacterium]